MPDRVARDATPALHATAVQGRCWIVGVVLLLSGCETTAWKPDFASSNPPDRTAAIEATMRRYRPDLDAPYTPPTDDPRFREDICWLVVMLQSDDAAVRFLAIESLWSLLAERNGYDFAAPLPERAVAVQRWTTWLFDRGYVAESPLPPVGLLPPPA